MNVALFSNTDWYLYNFRLSLADQLLAAGHRVVLASPAGEYGSRLLAKGYDWRPVAMSRAGGNPFSELAAVAGLARMLRAERIDVVHAFTIKASVFGAVAAGLARVPARVSSVAGLGYVFASRDLKARLLRPLLARLMRWTLAGGQARVILQNSDDFRLFFEHAIVPVRQLRLVRSSGVDTQRFSPSCLPRRPGALRVLLPARLLLDKGLAEYVGCSRLVGGTGRAVEFFVAGSQDPGNPASVSQGMLADWKQSSPIHWLGHVDDMPALLRTMDVVVLPSYREGLPKGLIEAGACGCALVTTDVEGCREVVTHEADGLLVPARDADALARAVARLHDDPALRARLGAAAREGVLARFDQRQVNDETISIYLELLAR